MIYCIFHDYCISALLKRKDKCCNMFKGTNSLYDEKYFTNASEHRFAQLFSCGYIDHNVINILQISIGNI